MKTLYIVAGCNGAGKTTASYTILPELLECREYVNADEIAKGLSPFNPESVAIDAGRLMLQRIQQLLNGEESFSIETTLANLTHTKYIDLARQNGFKITLLFFWLNSPETAIRRVKQRVSEGGHNIPEEVIRRRYDGGLKNLFCHYMPIVDYWALVDNTNQPRTIIAESDKSKEKIYNTELYHNIKAYANKTKK